MPHAPSASPLTPETLLLRAQVVAPMIGGCHTLRDAAVLIRNGRIERVGAVPELRELAGPSLVELDLGRSVLTPGLVNPHTHLELSGLTCGDAPASFVDWIVSLQSNLRRKEPDFPKRIADATRAGIAQCLRFGVTTVGDISAQPEITRPILAASPLRCVSFGEALGLGAARARFETGLATAVDRSTESERLRIGISPHAPYTVDRAGFAQCVQIAGSQRLPLATHLSETKEEATFVLETGGPFRALWERLGGWEDGVASFDGSPVSFARAVGLLGLPGAVLAHVNYCSDDDLNLLAGGRASVVFCPRTHAFFGHRPHRWREMLARGITVAVGTDSCASSPDLNPLSDLRLLWRRYGHVMDAGELWMLITANAAAALGLGETVGMLAPGTRADLAAFPLLHDVDPLGAILDNPQVQPSAVWIDGRKVF